MSHIPGAVGRAPEGTGWPLVEVQSAMTVEDDSGGVVPRFRRSYTHRQCEQRGKLRAFHWSDLEIDEVLGEPDTTTPTGKPAYGSDRVILGSMMLESSSFWPWPSLVPVWKDVLLDDEDDEEDPDGDGAIDPYYQQGRYDRPEPVEDPHSPGGEDDTVVSGYGLEDEVSWWDRPHPPMYLESATAEEERGEPEPVVFTRAELRACGPPAVPVKPAGQAWMGLCQRLDAEPGQDLVLRTRSGPRLKTVRRVHAVWGDFALAYLNNPATGSTLY